ncbi:hypothetical protein CVT24_009400 [Panaeolus cyanescens]|uniref:Uncharacterized protein n=1 Tax=Panaeolus cyanescens TaxID=181874 RepID=A0A409VAT7_9AGAR|nr:hypothetical protein CVT24_009400 [Panaeolus cyanescens]
MAGLPPKPETVPVRDERRFADDRDHRSAVPMSVRRYPPIPDRERDRERPYVPRPKLDSYIAPAFESRRDIDPRREYDDRDRERYRPPDDRRSWTRDRDFGRRDTDRRPYDRERDRGPPLPRRPQSPRRGYQRDSRSPAWRRPRSRSRSITPPRYRHRSRSRSPRRMSSPPLIRLGERSIHSHPPQSPAKVKHSREASPQLPPKPVHHVPPPPVGHATSSSRSIEASPRVHSVDERNLSPAHMQSTQHSANPPSPNVTPSSTMLLIKQEPEPTPVLHEEPLPIKVEHHLTPSVDSQVSKFSPKVEPPSNDFFEHESTETRIVPPKVEPKLEQGLNSPSLTTPISTKRSLSPPPVVRPMAESVHTAGSQDSKGWSAPRGPRAFARLPPQPAPAMSATRKRSRYEHISPALSNFPVPSNPIQKHQIKHADVIKIEQEIEKIHMTAIAAEKEHLQYVKGLQRALHELDLATIDLRAAETRRKIADAQLERAKTGTLGIDGSDTLVALI